MKLITKPTTKLEIVEMKVGYGDLVKITVDIETEILVLGCELHADGEEILLNKGSKQEDIWGGWINLNDGSVEMTAVLNIRPSLDNPSMEIINQTRREKFTKVVHNVFNELWQ